MYVHKIEDLLALTPADLTLVSGQLTATVSTISTPEKIKKNSLVFASTKEQSSLAFSGSASIVVALESAIPVDIPGNICVLSTRNIKRAMTYILPLFDSSFSKFHRGVHPSAVISNDTVLGKNISVGANSFIGKNVRIGDNTTIGPNTVIEDDVTIGKNTILNAQIYVGHNCIIGDHCEIHAHTTIGSDGFGFFTDQAYTHHKVPQIGNVVVEDNVEIGASCCIDRATIESTIIGKGSKLDNLCHIAHNCTIGENSLIAGGFFVAGSTHIGKRFTTGGSTVVSTQLQIADGVTLAGRSTVTNDVIKEGQYGGYPLQPLKDALKTISTLGNIVEMRKKINLVLKTLSIKE